VEALMRIPVYLLLCMLPTLAQADEHFEFHRLTCNKAANEIKIEPVRLWNLQDKIWGDGTWAQHVALMKALEKDHQLYVFDKDYGYYDDQREIIFRCGTIVARIGFEHYKKKMKAPSEPREIRINPFVWLYTSKGRAIASNGMWNSTESGMNAYGVSMNDKSTEITVYRVKLSEDPADVTCCFPRAPGR
jgi:hypothetical protein